MSKFVAMVKRVLRKPGYVKTLFFASAVLPTNTGRVIIEEGAAGLKLLHTSNTVAEADMLRQLLADAGFYVEYVPSASTGMFGTSGSSSIYVQPAEYEDAKMFINQFYSNTSTVGDNID